MNFHHASLVAVAIVRCFAPIGGPTSAASEERRKALSAAHQGDFDYLPGEWEFTSENKQYGEFSGQWTAVRLETAQVLDEYRVLGGDGETIRVTSTVRSYDSAADRWELIGMDRGGGSPVTMRIRYYNIRPDRLSWSPGRSTDDGKTWTPDFQRIEARRIGPARSLGALAPAAKVHK